ncbi:MAG TPA: HAMP domain-containing sensor histidine kinase [Gaiellaceae bacterium]
MIRLDSLRTRLFAAIVLIVVLSVGLSLLLGALLTRREVEKATLRGVANQADLLAARENQAVLPFARLPAYRDALARQGELVINARLDGSSPWVPRDKIAPIRAKKRVQGTETVNGTRYFYAARFVHPKALVLVRPTRLGATASRPFVENLILAAFVGAVLAAIVAYLLARAISRPVDVVAKASRRAAASLAPEPVPVEGARELALLAESFNQMARQLTKARAAERQFLLSVSHELKTPLTAIRGYAEGLADGAFDPQGAAETIAQEAERLERLVRDLLDLARVNRTDFSFRTESIDLGVAARETVRRYETQARSFGVTLEAIAPDTAPALGDSDRTLQIVSNLVENALRATPPGGTVRVIAEPGAIAVEDSGPGLQPDEVPRAFERFFLYSRYGGERPVGTGLGLAIVKELTEGMSGSVQVESEPGGVTRFVVRLPVPADEPVVLPTPYVERIPG